MPHHTFAEQLERVFTRHAVRSLIFNYMVQGIGIWYRHIVFYVSHVLPSTDINSQHSAYCLEGHVVDGRMVTNILAHLIYLSCGNSMQGLLPSSS